MRRARRWRGAARAAALVAIAALAPAAARADAVSVALEPGFTHGDTEVTTQAGRTTRERLDLLTQNYRLSLDRSLTDQLLASLGGTFLDQRAWRDVDGVPSLQTARATALFGRLTLGLPTLTVGVGADRHEERFLASSASSFVTESYSAFALWRPGELPEVNLRVGRVHAYDDAHRVQDATTDSAVFGARYEARHYGARYLVTWNHTTDALNRTDSTAVDQTVLGTWNDSLFEGRTAAYASGTFTNRNSSISAQGGGTIARQQAPVAGLSGVEALPATALDIALAPNPLVIDGNTSATAGVDVGFGTSALGDRNARDVGARFADVVTPVNTLYVWFDRPLTPAVGGALAASVAVYRSDDNQRWTPIDLDRNRPPVVSPFENRIEITVAQVQARYLKVALAPLALGVTTDSAYRNLLVTELQLLLVLPAALVPRNQTTYTATANVTARTALLQGPDLAHDVQASVARQSEGVTTYAVVNGLSLAQRLTRTIVANARGARQDQDAGRGHEGIWLWSAAVTGNPYPTAYWSVNYSGTANDRDQTVAHSLTALGRADLYEGISTQVNGTASFLTQAEQTLPSGIVQGERTASTGQAGATASFTPNRFVTLTTGVLYSRSVAFTPETGDVVTDFGRADASLSLTPAPALSAAGTVSRVFLGARPTTLATLQLNYFPLRGELQLSFAYSKTLDTTADATAESWGPSLRWNVRRGVALTSSYTVLENAAPAQTLRSRVLSANLLVTL